MWRQNLKLPISSHFKQQATKNNHLGKGCNTMGNIKINRKMNSDCKETLTYIYDTEHYFKMVWIKRTEDFLEIVTLKIKYSKRWKIWQWISKKTLSKMMVKMQERDMKHGQLIQKGQYLLGVCRENTENFPELITLQNEKAHQVPAKISQRLNTKR